MEQAIGSLVGSVTVTTIVYVAGKVPTITVFIKLNEPPGAIGHVIPLVEQISLVTGVPTSVPVLSITSKISDEPVSMVPFESVPEVLMIAFCPETRGSG